MGLLILATLVWAAVELSGQVNAAAADAGKSSLEMEDITLSMVSNPKSQGGNSPACDWQKEKELRNGIDKNNAEYKQLAEKAKSEAEAEGQTSSATASAIRKSAETYKKLQTDYATMWEACKCKTRAKVAKELAETRIKNAEVVAGGAKEESIKALEEQQTKLNDARHAYVEQAKRDGEFAPEDKKQMQAQLIPRTKTLLTDITGLAAKVQNLMTQVQETATEATSGGVFGAMSAASKLAQGGGGLLSPVKALFSMVQTMMSNAQSLQADLQLISQ